VDNEEALTQRLYDFAAGVLDGKIYVAARWNTQGEMYYDPLTDTWTALPGGGVVNNSAMASSVLNNKLHVAGDCAATRRPRYIPMTQQTDELKEHPCRYASVPTSGAVERRLYVMGGISGKSVQTQVIHDLVEKYEPEFDRWTAKTPMPTARFGAAAAVIHGRIYVVGGYGEVDSGVHAFLNTLEVHDPSRGSLRGKPS
jgi:N-acetylneuraminic acid mutarotase